jgi:hypothetical protein
MFAVPDFHERDLRVYDCARAPGDVGCYLDTPGIPPYVHGRSDQAPMRGPHNNPLLVQYMSTNRLLKKGTRKGHGRGARKGNPLYENGLPPAGGSWANKKYSAPSLVKCRRLAADGYHYSSCWTFWAKLCLRPCDFDAF